MKGRLKRTSFFLCLSLQSSCCKTVNMKKKASHFDKFKPKKSNAAIKESFRQEKRKAKKEREAYFEKKKAEAREIKSNAGRPGHKAPPIHTRSDTGGQMPLNKFIAHAGVAARREAADLVRHGL